MHLKFFSILIFLILSISKGFCQIDSGKEIKTDLFDYIPEDSSQDQQLKFDFSNVEKEVGETITLFGTLEEIARIFPNYTTIREEKKMGMMIRKMDKDILVKKYWGGKDVSISNLNTKLELGRIETKSRRIRIECRDHSYVDGDRVRVYLNEQVIRSNVVLQGGYYIIDIDLKEGFNRIDIEALNQGSSGPNTAEFNVYDEHGSLLASKEWNILTGYIATLIVEKY